MKRKLLVFAWVMSGLILNPLVNGQESQPGAKLTRAEKRALKQTEASEQIKQVNGMVADSYFVLEPNRVSGYDVNAHVNFLLVSGDTVIFQTSRPTDRSRSGILLTDKTVIGKITSKFVKTDPKTGYHQLKLNVMTEVGAGFRVDLRVAPTGNATALISRNTSSGQLEYQGRIVSLGQSDISVYPESFDLAGFPWYYNTCLGGLSDR